MSNTNRISDFLKKNWLFLLIAVQPLLDVLAFWTQSESGTAAGMIRLACMAGLCIYVLLRKPSAGFFAAMGITAAVFGIHVLNCFRIGYMSPAADIKYIARVVYMPVMAICFCSLPEKDDLGRQLIRGILISAAFEAVVIVLSAVTNTFTYTYTVEKLGISGWVIDSNRCCHSDILSTVAVFISCYAAETEKKWLKYLLPVLVFAALVTNGTTACYLTLLAVMAGFPVFLVFRSVITREKTDVPSRLLMAEMAILFALSIVIYPVTPRYKMEEIERNSYSDNEQRFVQEMADLGYDIYSMSLEEKMSDPVVYEKLTTYYTRFVCSTVESMRDRFGIDRVIYALNGTVSAEVLGDTRNMKRLNAQFIFEDGDTLTRFTGFEFTNLRNDYEDLENDWYALYYYYGYIGLAAYILAAVFILIRIGRLLAARFRESLSVLNFALLMCFVLQLGLAFFSGAMLRRPNASIYLSCTTALIWYQTVLPGKAGDRNEA